MAFFPVAPGHRIQPFIQPRGGNSLPPSLAPETCLWSSLWSWGTEQWQQLHGEIKSWSQVRKEKQNRDQTVTTGGGQTYPAKTAKHILLRAIPWEGPSFQPPRTGMSMHSRTSYIQGASPGGCELPRSSLYSSFCSVPPQHNLAPCSCLGKAWPRVTVAPANPHLHQGDRSRGEEGYHSRMSTHPSCRCWQESTHKVKGNT